MVDVEWPRGIDVSIATVFIRSAVPSPERSLVNDVQSPLSLFVSQDLLPLVLDGRVDGVLRDPACQVHGTRCLERRELRLNSTGASTARLIAQRSP